ncbi:DNA mismatch repair endonuclease MutL [Nannocystis radixulma]|uniref:DNA mismatch repair protein MutL n=1 Tax=Nannocystis radixulma TaxID=2995305 RepID=A0ABT5BAN0_9BACT|nr:DNA mismatch repair endonuclease MutL [Nannocystis radixulma]MDC0671195.1 DNA mismatch repair endonuclease MutL [Nannocystis radixulma]
MNSPAPAASGRIAVLGALVIDQIAAGEVVERPASVVKELVDNSLDAGATRVDVELEDGGLARISVRDNGRGIHPDDFLLAVTRHATSKLRYAADIADIATLGFRGEALASVAAVARVDLRSRQPGATVGVHLHGIPGEAPTLTPAGMPVGTQIDVHALFANVPARRKFMRAEATEVGHVSDTLLRLAIVHPGVHFTLRHGKRELLNLPRATREGRVAQVLERRVAGPFFTFRGEDDGVRVEAFLPHPTAAARGRGSPYLITRQRVVRERSLAQILTQAYGLGGEAPSACLFVEPPAGAVDVNVHPQKAEVRFSEPQQVYAAVRRILAAAVAAAPWAGELAGASGHVSKDLSSAPAEPEADEPARERATVPPGRGGAIPIGFAPVRVSPGPGEAARARTRVDDEDDADDDLPEDVGATPGGRRGHPARPARDEDVPGTPRRAAVSVRSAPDEDEDEDRAPETESGPAVRRIEQAAAAAAAGRRAEAEAWLSRAEASIDATRRPLVEAERPSAAPARAARPASGPVAAAASADAGWDLDLADAPAAGDRDMSHRADGDARDSHGSPDMSVRASGHDAAREAHASPDMSVPTSAPPAARRADAAAEPVPADMSLRTSGPPSDPVPADMSLRAADGQPLRDDREAVAWMTRAGAASDLPDPARERAAAWAERAGAEPPPDLHAGADPLLRWSERQPDPEPRPQQPASEDRRPGAYRLSTRALDTGYDRHKRSVMDAAAALRPDGAAPRTAGPERDESLALLPVDTGDMPVPRDMREQTGPISQPAAPPRPDIPALLACLPGPVAVFADRDSLLAVDLRRVRSHLVYLRLQRDLVGRRAVAVQGLLSPAVVQRPPADVALIQAARAELLGLGVDLDVFGDDAVVVRGVPAHLRHCVDDADAADLVARIVPWLRIRSGDGDRAARERGLLDAIATTHGGDPAPRLARRWLAELVDAGASLESVPGIRRWSASALLGGE